MENQFRKLNEEHNEHVVEQSKTIDAISKTIKPLLDSLEDVLRAVKEVNDKLGFTERCQMIRESIKKHGWTKIRDLFHPDNQPEDPAAHHMFQLYKVIHEDMLRKKEIS